MPGWLYSIPLTAPLAIQLAWRLREGCRHLSFGRAFST